MTHTDPTFRALLLDLAEAYPPELAAIGELADLLEDRGDERAWGVHRWRCWQVLKYDDGKVSFWYASPKNSGTAIRTKDSKHQTPDRAAVDLASSVLFLFPEGPRWRLRLRSVSVPEKDGLRITLYEPHRNSFLTLAECRAANQSISLPIEGPIWPDPVLS